MLKKSLIISLFVAIILGIVIVYYAKASLRKEQNPYVLIEETIESWVKNEVNKGNLCYDCPDYSKMPTIDAANLLPKYNLHKVDSSFNIKYQDINGDNIIDAFVTFTPTPCYSSSNNEMFMPNSSILILSNTSAGYNVDTTTIPLIRRVIENNFKEVFANKITDNYTVEIDKISSLGFSGNLRVQTNQDVCHACTSLVGNFEYNSSDKKIYLTYYYYDKDKDTKQKISENSVDYVFNVK
jgi:hypothetical protein